MLADPFRVPGPAVVSFSGGRTSAYMLWRVLQAYGGTLPEDVLVCFANTGREMPATLDFVHRCGSAWNVPIHWLEYHRDAQGHVSAVEVSHNSASREGEPFAMAIAAKAMLPNPVIRYCTVELKIRTIRRWCVDQFGKGITWTQVVGLRADEPNRVERMLSPKARKKAGAESRYVVLPLATAGITKPDVMAFWSRQPFDLGLKGAWEGNCDGCFLKRRAAVARMFRDHPERMTWWEEVEEARKADHPRVRKPGVALFRMDRPPYSEIRRIEMDQARLDLDPEDDGMDVFAACDAGCGV
jgi:3'-phosphoadenosine 5'-phosphosulfate sulfotransferase (PAPS reductase)/FAD synthetase